MVVPVLVVVLWMLLPPWPLSPTSTLPPQAAATSAMAPRLRQRG
jgi:hypothetical protein